MYFTRLGLRQRGGILTGETTVRVRSKYPASRLHMKACEGPANVGLLSIALSRLLDWKGRRKEKLMGQMGLNSGLAKGKYLDVVDRIGLSSELRTFFHPRVHILIPKRRVPE